MDGLPLGAQIPQFILIGASEILSSVTSLEFFYAEAPHTMRGVSAGLNLLTTALGSWLTVPLLRLVSDADAFAAWMGPDSRVMSLIRRARENRECPWLMRCFGFSCRAAAVCVGRGVCGRCRGQVGAACVGRGVRVSCIMCRGCR